MSDLLMDMHHRRLNRAAAASQMPMINFNSDDSTGTLPSRATTKASTNACQNDDDDDDGFENVLNLKLRKPKHWKWELTTSRSCSNIALPRILLYNHKGDLLADANSQEEGVYRQEDFRVKRNETRKRSNKAATTNLAHSIRQALDREFNGLQIQEATPSLKSTNESTRRNTPSGSSVDFYTNDLPDYQFNRRSNSLKGVRFKVDESKDSNGSFHVVDLPTPPSTSNTITTTTSTSSGPREKRRYRRPHSSGRSPGQSESILERFSFNRGRFSSPEYAEEHDVQTGPRYFLRTSKAGTLLLKEESFSRYRRRRRPKNSSSENILNSPKSQSTNSLKMSDSLSKHLKLPNNEPKAGSLQNVSELRERASKKQYPVRRYRSDGNVLIQQPLSTSDEEEGDEETSKTNQMNSDMKPFHKYPNYRKSSKKDLMTIHHSKDMPYSIESPTAR